MPPRESDLSERRNRALEQARAQLGTRYPERFSSMFSYGAIDIDPKHLVVWVLLAGPPAELPARYFPGGHSSDDASYATDLLAQIEDMRRIVVGSFRAEAWPDAEHVDVAFDSLTRVNEAGWNYFR